MKRYRITLFTILILVALYVASMSSGGEDEAPENDAPSTLKEQNTPYIKIKDAVLHVELANNPEKQIKGLSGRDTLSANSGMLFIFEEEDYHGIWMPDMKFSIDIIWVDKNFRIVDMKENATPESYPEVFKPENPALYVLEISSGSVKEYRIAIGDYLIFNK